MLAGDEHVGIAWMVLLGFLRLTTRSAILPAPITIEQASGVIDEWLDQPPCVVVHPGERHWEILRGLLSVSGAAGNLTTDAHLAALAIEHDATLCSADRDFLRFGGLRFENPLAPA